MSLLTRFISLFLIFSLILGPVFAQDWQGLAGRGRSGDFPSGGFYAASNAFPKNSLVDVVNPLTGKTVRVIVTRELKDPSLFMALSPEASDQIGLESGRSISVTADAIPLPGTSGTRFVQEPAYSNDPDVNPSASIRGTPVPASPAPSQKPQVAIATPTPAPSLAPTPAPLPSPTPEPVATISPQIAVIVPTATPAPSIAPSPAPSVAPTPVPSESPTTADQGTRPASPAPVGVTAIAQLPPPSVPSPSPSPSSAGTPVRRWIGVQNGLDSLRNAPINSVPLGDLARAQPSPSPQASAAPATPAPSTSQRGAGIAQGLNTYRQGTQGINPGDVARPEQGLWLKGANDSKVASQVPRPKVSEDPDSKGPDVSVAGTKPKVSAGSSYTLVNPQSPTAKASPAPQASKAPAVSLVSADGNGLYEKSLSDAVGRGNIRSGSVPSQDSGLADASSMALAPQTSIRASSLPGVKVPAQDTPSGASARQTLTDTALATTLPEARLKAFEAPVASFSSPGSSQSQLNAALAEAKTPASDSYEASRERMSNPPGSLAHNDLPIAVVGKSEQADAAMAGGNPETLNIASELPVARVQDSATAEGSLELKADPPVVQSNLPESKVGSAERPETPSPVAFADQVLMTLEPADHRPPRVPASATAEAGSHLNAESTSVANAALGEPKTSAYESADAASAGGTVPAGQQIAIVGAEARAPGRPEAAPFNQGTQSAFAGDLKNPRLPGTADASPYAQGNQAGAVSGDLQNPKLPGTADASPYAQGNQTGAVSGDLKNPKLPGTADAGAVAVSPAGTIPGSLTNPALQNPEGTIPGSKPNPAGKVPSTLADALAPSGAKPTPGPVSTSAPRPSASPAPIDPRVAQILGYLEPAGSKPANGTAGTAGTVSNAKPGVVPAAVFNDGVWASQNLPLISQLQRQSWYVQVGSYQSPRVAGDTLRRVTPGYQVAVLPESSRGQGLYKVFVGPLREDEKGLVLYWFRSKGYKDAFVREGAVN